MAVASFYQVKSAFLQNQTNVFIRDKLEEINQFQDIKELNKLDSKAKGRKITILAKGRKITILAKVRCLLNFLEIYTQEFSLYKIQIKYKLTYTNN